MEPMLLAECLPSAVKEMLASQIFENAERDQERESSAYRAGYADGFQSGDEVGYGRAHHEMAEAWRVVYETVQRAARTKSFPELQRVRYGNNNAHTKESRNAA